MLDIKVVGSRRYAEIKEFIEDLDKFSDDKTIFHTDGYKAYSKHFTETKQKHTINKRNTTQVESFNYILRMNNSSLHRRSRSVCHSKSSLHNVLKAMCFLYNKKIKNIYQFLNLCCTFVCFPVLNGNNNCKLIGLT